MFSTNIIYLSFLQRVWVLTSGLKQSLTLSIDTVHNALVRLYVCL